MTMTLIPVRPSLIFPKYQIVYADPPWQYKIIKDKNYDKKHVWRDPASHYQTMATEDICKLPIRYVTAEDSILFLWATFPKLLDALQVIEAWGFEYQGSAFLWVKQNINSMSFFEGMGYWTRKNTEPCLLAIKGHPKRIAKDVPELIVTTIMAHSHKPNEITRGRIEKICGKLSRIELFARQKAEGWDSWGNEVPNSVDLIEIGKICGTIRGNIDFREEGEENKDVDI